MTSPIDSETLPPGESGARLPSLGSPELSPAFLAKVKEIIESLLGRRGSQWDRAVTFRDLAQGGLIVPSAGAGAWQPNDAGAPNVVLRTQLENELRNSAAFRNLMTRIGSVDDLAQYPDEIRAQLATSIADLARQRQADLVTIERKIQSSNLSFASRLEEITAALDDAAAGVRHLDSAYSDRTGSMAASITQVQAQLGTNPGDGVTVEEKLVAQANDIDGLQGQWSVKIQAGSDANPVIAGIALSATSPTAGAGTSALVILADKFGVFTSGGSVMPFGVDATGAYINGLLRVNSAGTALQDIAVGAKRLELTSSSQVFQISKAGTNSPSSITLSARALNLAGSPNWTVPAGTATLSAGADAWNKTLTFANMTSDTVQIQVAQDGLVDTVTIIKVREGTDAINGLLTNEAANVATAADGSGASYAGTGGTFKVFDGVTDKTGDAAVTYSVAAATGVTIGIAATGVYTITAMSADTGSATLRAVYKGVTIDKVYSIARSKAGAAAAPAAYVVVAGQQVFSRATAAATFAPASITLAATPYGGSATYQWQYLNAGSWTSIAGATAATYAVASGDFADQRTYRVQATIGGTVYTDQITLVQVTGGTSAVNGFLTNESVTLAADSTGAVASFTPANGTFKLYDGITDKTGAAVTYSVASQTGCTVAITTAGAYSVSAMSADTATATLRAVYGGVTIDKVLSLAKSRAGGTGSTGARGAGHWYTSGSAWSDATADAACPGGKVVGDVVTISSGAFVDDRRWSGTAWDALGTVVNGTLLVTKSVKTAALDTYAVTTEKMVITGSNLVPNSDFATGDLTNWRPYAGTANISVISGSFTSSATSEYVCKMDHSSGAQTSMFTHASAYSDANAHLDGFAVTAGEQYATKIDMVKSSSMVGTELRVIAFFYKKDGTYNTAITTINPLSTVTSTSFQTFTGSFTVPADALRCWLFVRFTGTAGYVCWTNLRCSRMMDSALVVDGGILAQHLSVTTLQAITATTGALNVTGQLTIAAGGALSFGQTAYDTGTGGWIQGGATPKMSMRSATGKFLRIDPGNEVFEFSGGRLINVTLDTFTLAALTDLNTSAGNGSRTVGSRTMTPTGGKGTITYHWYFSWCDPGLTLTNENTATVSVVGNGNNVLLAGRVIGIATDQNGLIAMTDFKVTAGFGTY